MEKETNLNDFGEVFKMPREDFQKYLKETGEVSCLDKETNCLYTLTTTMGFRQYFERPSIWFKKENLTTGVIEEKFYNLSNDINFREIYKKFSDLKDISAIYSRCYVDVTTKYGTFCLEADEHFSHSNYGPHRSLSLYNVTHDNEVFQNHYSKYIYPKFGVLKLKHMSNNNFNQWLVGHIDNMFQNPRRSIWNFGPLFEKDANKGAEDGPIYCMSDYADSGLGFRGAIILNGNIKIASVENFLPDCFANLEVDEYEKEPVTSKIYYGNADTIVVLKNGYKIKVIYSVFNPRAHRIEEKESVNIRSFTEGPFTKDDFERIKAYLYLMDIEEGLKASFTTELVTYINLHTSDFNTLTNTLTNVTYDRLKEIMMNSNLPALVENLLNKMSETFSISINDLLGKKDVKKGRSRKVHK